MPAGAPEEPSRRDWSHDGRLLAYEVDYTEEEGHVAPASLRRPETTAIPDDKIHEKFGLKFSPDSKQPPMFRMSPGLSRFTLRASTNPESSGFPPAAVFGRFGDRMGKNCTFSHKAPSPATEVKGRTQDR